MVIFRQREKELYSAEFDITKGAETIGHASFSGNMASVFGEWDIDVCGKNIRLRRTTLQILRKRTGNNENNCK